MVNFTSKARIIPLMDTVTTLILTWSLEVNNKRRPPCLAGSLASEEAEGKT